MIGSYWSDSHGDNSVGAVRFAAARIDVAQSANGAAKGLVAVSDHIPKEVSDLYEVHDHRHAAVILSIPPAWAACSLKM